ncbi:hypothetical protein [Saccharicrinis aurantiacus]|uniref:hypothetical protein n=1 Tax=Saccharicrinis aurantiacus TaxID=1849719 RepID=UPI0024925700|nr:hypothetical protein [Saccharicrinis aurantiacus]
MQENNFELVLTDEEQTAIDDAIGVLESTLLPKLIVLDKSEKSDLLRMGDKSVAFVDKSLEVAKLDAPLLSAFVNVAAMSKDVDALSTLRTYAFQLDKIVGAINDSKALAGHEAYNASLMVYSLMKNAASMGHPGAKEKVNELKKRFPRTRSKTSIVE